MKKNQNQQQSGKKEQPKMSLQQREQELAKIRVRSDGPMGINTGLVYNTYTKPEKKHNNSGGHGFKAMGFLEFRREAQAARAVEDKTKVQELATFANNLKGRVTLKLNVPQGAILRAAPGNILVELQNHKEFHLVSAGAATTWAYSRVNLVEVALNKIKEV